MGRIYLTRHGETEYNKRKIEMGQLDIPLSKRGTSQAERLAARLQETSLSAIYASPLKRSMQTANAIADAQGLDIETRDGLKERSYGEMEGKDTALIREQLDETGQNWSEWKPPGGETRAEATARAQPVLEELAQQHQDEKIAVVAHSGMNKGLITSFICGNPNFGHRVTQGLTCVNEIEYKGNGEWRVHTMNDTGHL